MRDVTPDGGRHLIVSFLAVVLVSGAVAPAVLTSGIGGSHASVVAGTESKHGGSALAATTPTENTENETTRHENPAEVNGNGDLENVQNWLLGRIGERLEGSAINISQGQYNAAEGLLGGETREYLDKFVDVAGETENEEDDETAETVNKTINKQRNFTRTRQNYSDLYNEYLEAIENGNTSRARRLARKLADLERRLNRTRQTLSQYYRTIENRTGINTNEGRRSINRTVRNVSEIQAEIRETLFNETQIVVHESTTNASVVDPIVVRGQVVVKNETSATSGAINETPATTGDIVLANGLGTRVSINATGHFTLRHRPVLLRQGVRTLTLQYRPPAESGYLGSTTSIKTTIRGREPTLEIVAAPNTTGFGQTLSVEVRLTVGNRSIEGVPIEAALDGVLLGSTATVTNTTTVSGTVPAVIDDGSQKMRITLPFSGRAVKSTNATRTIQVQETDTRLTTDLTALSSTRIRVQGRLKAVDGTPVSGQSVRIDIAGINARSVQTNATGGFDAVVTIPQAVTPSAFAGRRVPVNATFIAPTTNLAPSNASGVVAIPSNATGEVTVTTSSDPDESGGLFGIRIPWWVWIALVVLIVGIWVYLGLPGLTEREWADTTGDKSMDESGGETDVESGSEPESTDQDIPPSPLEIASDRLTEGMTDTATETAYGAVRQRLVDHLGVTAATHRDLYRACQETEWPKDRIEAIQRLTEAYEQAAFAPESLPVETAQEALTIARDILDERDVPSGGD